MPTYDLPLDELRRYAPALSEPADFDDFWAETLALARSHELAGRINEGKLPASAEFRNLVVAY